MNKPELDDLKADAGRILVPQRIDADNRAFGKRMGIAPLKKKRKN